MSIDEKAIEIAARAYLDYNGDEADLFGRCGSAMKKALEAYEAAKSDQPQPVDKPVYKGHDHTLSLTQKAKDYLGKDAITLQVGGCNLTSSPDQPEPDRYNDKSKIGLDYTRQPVECAGLLPCPFCGGEACVVATGDPFKYSVFCGVDECSMESVTTYHTTENQAKQAWNRRTPPVRESGGQANITELANEVNGAFSNNAATGNLDKAAAVRQALNWVALRYTITPKENVNLRSGEPL